MILGPYSTGPKILGYVEGESASMAKSRFVLGPSGGMFKKPWHCWNDPLQCIGFNLTHIVGVSSKVDETRKAGEEDEI